MRKWAVTAALLAGVLGVAGPASAKKNQGVQGHIFEPSLDGFGIHSIDSADVLAPGQLHLGLIYDYSKNQTEIGLADDTRTGDLLSREAVNNYMIMIGLPFDLAIGATLPHAVYADGNEFEDQSDLDTTGPHDMRLELKWNAYESDNGEFLAGVKLDANLPRTGKSSKEFRSEDEQMTLHATGLFEWRWERYRLLADIGYEWLEEDIKFGGAHVDDRVHFGVGGAVSLWREINFREVTYMRHNHVGNVPFTPCEMCFGEHLWELSFELSLNASFRARHPSDEVTFPVEINYGFKLDMPHNLTAVAGGGSGLTNGIGAPDWRWYVGLRWTTGSHRPTLYAPTYHVRVGPDTGNYHRDYVGYREAIERKHPEDVNLGRGAGDWNELLERDQIRQEGLRPDEIFEEVPGSKAKWPNEGPPAKFETVPGGSASAPAPERAPVRLAPVPLAPEAKAPAGAAPAAPAREKAPSAPAPPADKRGDALDIGGR
ncbi:MAG: hypothetical protein ACYTFT_14965 [Planctomycetota bacterium]|jgi:hypothetical protein